MNEVSQKQIEANRQNAKLGGVKTDEGQVFMNLVPDRPLDMLIFVKFL